MSGLNRKLKRTEARREYDRFTKMWREDMRLAGIYGKKSKYRRPSFSQWYAQHEHELGGRPSVQAPSNQEYLEQLGVDPWAEQLDERITREVEPEVQRGVTTIQIVGDEEA
jgi:hypothetical protein